MQTKRLVAILIASTAIFLSCNKTGPVGPLGPQGDEGPSLSGNLRGYVNHYDVSGAKITTDLAGTVISIDGTARTATTDANGLYSLLGLTTGVYNLSIQPISVTYGSVSASYGSVKVQSLQFIGGNDTYYDINLSIVPTGVVSTSIATITTPNITIAGTVSPATSFAQSVIVYVGAPSSTVDVTSTNYMNYYTGSVAANGTTYAVTIPITELQYLGYQTGDTINFATYLIGNKLEASRYIDYSTNKTIYTAISASSASSTVIMP